MITLEQAKELFFDYQEPLKTEMAQAHMRVVNSRDTVLNIPQWATWTEEETRAWYDTNIGNPLQTNIPATVNLSNIRPILVDMLTIMRAMGIMLWAMARMLLALRNKNWPNL